ncbi:MAG: efflux RND transporter periplasmic adaptor subunit [Candidatus Hydrogenedentes bacterium]|nr:efflux RND transporter periplasmic adaptor subunit [Candidatus Hydrogenedentota bacterium]
MQRSLKLPAYLTLIVLLSACDQTKKPVDAAATGAEGEAAEVIIPVQVSVPERASISEYFETTARVEAEARVEVTAQGMGKCTHVKAEEGQRVARGDVLAELDKEESLTMLRQAEVQVNQQQNQFQRAKDGLALGLTPKVEYDNARFAYEQAVASLETRKIQVDNLTVRAPISGIVTKKNVQVGMLVSSGMPVFSVVDPSTFLLVIYAPEKELTRVRVGQAAKVAIDAIAGEEFDTTVRRINPGVDPQTGTVKVVLDFDKEVRSRLRDAAFARVRLVMDTHEDAMLIPKDAVFEENARHYVFVIGERSPESEKTATETPATGTDAEPKSEATSAPEGPVYLAQRVEVDTGLEDSASVEILGGIDENAQVVTMGQHTLKSGTKVTITDTNAVLESRLAITTEQALATAKEKRAAGAKTLPALGGRRRMR